MTYQYDNAGNISNITNSIASETSTYGYDQLHRLTSWNLNGTTENYSYDSAGNLDVKAGVDLNYNDTSHKHAVTHIGSTQKYWYDANGNQITRIVGADTFNLAYDAENRLVEVKKNTVVMATFTYDGDGRRVKSVMGSETILFVGAHYEVKGSEITKYYFAGASRIAMRKYTVPVSISVEYFLGDHLGSTSITTDNAGTKVSEMRYKPWGEVRYSWTSAPVTTPSYKLSAYTFTGQYSYMDDPSTSGVAEGFGLMFYNARWYDPSLGRFAQADTITPQSQGVQAWDRYAYVNNNPANYTDPTGHTAFHVALLVAIVAVAAVAIVVGYVGDVEYRAREASGKNIENTCSVVETREMLSIVKDDLSNAIESAIGACTDPADSCSSTMAPAYPAAAARVAAAEARVTIVKFALSVFVSAYDAIDESIPDATPIPPYPTGTESAPPSIDPTRIPNSPPNNLPTQKTPPVRRVNLPY